MCEQHFFVLNSFIHEFVWQTRFNRRFILPLITFFHHFVPNFRQNLLKVIKWNEIDTVFALKNCEFRLTKRAPILMSRSQLQLLRTVFWFSNSVTLEFQTWTDLIYSHEGKSECAIVHYEQTITITKRKTVTITKTVWNRKQSVHVYRFHK